MGANSWFLFFFYLENIIALLTYKRYRCVSSPELNRFGNRQPPHRVFCCEENRQHHASSECTPRSFPPSVPGRMGAKIDRHYHYRRLTAKASGASGLRETDAFYFYCAGHAQGHFSPPVVQMEFQLSID
uniref:Putative secreted protein n=1 Tax=Anopheles darlingi TaxID=43151 RepID=A0A2M4D9K7_ANODA